MHFLHIQTNVALESQPMIINFHTLTQQLCFSAALSYMTVSTMLQQSQMRGELNILTYLSHALSSAPGLELQLAQYVFIHDVLSEALSAGNTSVVKHSLPQYVRSLEAGEGEGLPTESSWRNSSAWPRSSSSSCTRPPTST